MAQETQHVAAVETRQGTQARKQRIRSIVQVVGMLPVLILLCIFFELSNDRFFSLQNISIVAQQAAINIVLAAGMTFVILTGGIDLSVGSILAASATAWVVCSTMNSSMPPCRVRYWPRRP